MKKSVSFRLIIVQSMFRRKLLIYWQKRGERIILHFQLVCTKPPPRVIDSKSKWVSQVTTLIGAELLVIYGTTSAPSLTQLRRAEVEGPSKWSGNRTMAVVIENNRSTTTHRQLITKSKKRKEWLVKKLTVERLLKPINHCCAYLFRTELECGLWLGVFLS